MGDLSGGKIVGRTAQRLYGLAEDGLRFYRFEGIDDGHAFKEAYRSHLDAAPWTELERCRIIEDPPSAFE